MSIFSWHVRLQVQCSFDIKFICWKQYVSYFKRAFQVSDWFLVMYLTRWWKICYFFEKQIFFISFKKVLCPFTSLSGHNGKKNLTKKLRCEKVWVTKSKKILCNKIVSEKKGNYIAPNSTTQWKEYKTSKFDTMITFLQENISRNYSYQRVLLHINKVITGKRCWQPWQWHHKHPKTLVLLLSFNLFEQDIILARKGGRCWQDHPPLLKGTHNTYLLMSLVIN